MKRGSGAARIAAANSYPLDRLAQAGAIASLEDEAYVQNPRDLIISGREALRQGWQDLGFEVLPSLVNVILARHPDRDGGALAAQLREAAIVVRDVTAPRIDQYLRITTGAPQDNAKLLAALRALLAEHDTIQTACQTTRTTLFSRSLTVTSTHAVFGNASPSSRAADPRRCAGHSTPVSQVGHRALDEWRGAVALS